VEDTAKVILGIVLIGTLLYLASDVFLLLFAAVLFAVLLRTAGRGVNKLTKIPGKWAVLVALFGIIALFGTTGYLLAPSVSEQFEELGTAVPGAVTQLTARLTEYEWGRKLFSETQQGIPQPDAALLGRTVGVFSSLLGTLGSIAFVLALGIYIAMEPHAYSKGVVALMPLKRRARTKEALSLAWIRLRKWLIGTLLAMLTIGVLTTLGLWLLNVPLALALGVIAGLFAFVPTVGPILSAVPAVLIALLQSPRLALYVVLLYVAVQFVESYLVTPLIQRRTISMPPALSISFQVLMSALFGFMGLFLATPILVVAIAFIQLLYIEDKLGDKIVKRKKT
jgi:predicted PurR-regulated permease PerM